VSWKSQNWKSHLLNGAVLVVVIGLAGVIHQSSPRDEVWQSPIGVYGEIGDTITGRNIEVQVDQVRVTDSVVANNGWAGETTGIWVVVDATVSAVLTDDGSNLNTAQLFIDGITYGASERPDLGTLFKMAMDTGIPQSGPLMFEVPRDIVTSAAAEHTEIQFAFGTDPRADSLAVVVVDLAELETLPEVETSDVVWGKQ